MADEDDVCRRKSGKYNSRGDRIFLCCHLKKRSMIFCSSHERARGHAANTISAQDFFMVVNDNKNTFQAHFLEK